MKVSALALAFLVSGSPSLPGVVGQGNQVDSIAPKTLTLKDPVPDLERKDLTPTVYGGAGERKLLLSTDRMLQTGHLDPEGRRKLLSVPSVKKVKLTVPGNNKQLLISEAEVFAQVGGVETNVAPTGTAQMSSQHSSVSCLGPQWAIDGIMPSGGPWGCGTHSATAEWTDNPWWQVTLPTTHDVERVRLGLGPSFMSDRLSGAKLQLLDSADNIIYELCLGNNPSSPIDLDLTADACPGYDSSDLGTDAPTKSPTDAPTKTVPWDIMFQSIITNFGLNSTNQLVVDYRVGKQTFASELYKGGCKSTSSENTAISGIDVVMTPTSVDDTDGMKNITLSYSFDTANITTSNIWSTENNTTKIELCQVAQLTAAGPGGVDMVITEDMRNITIDFDLNVDFEIEGGVNLAGATIEAEQQNTTLADFITAFKCSGEFGSAEDSSALAPNTELHVCIKSVSDEVIINEIVSMQIDGTNPDNEDSSLPVIVDGAPAFPRFTTRSYAAPKPYEAIVTTRVPTNLFDFEATDANIAVSGALTVALDDGTRRRLAISKPVRALQDAGNEAAFDLKIELQPEEDAGVDLEDEGAMMMNSAKGAACKGTAILGMILASVYALW